ncbi:MULTISPECIES: restriction endonuclease subunit S [Bacteroidales]|uniref:restriction endonuclease subunit S n=1 Tax=Bacteroidales TaxID=171549 RepID=UPI001C378C2F|nr:restriction endonuclease subunit S [Alistipes finegoldii]MBV4369334.1 restriction endonuclease subunit S [Alistipes finegoldii]
MADNNENKVLNVPHLRFPEFTDEWKESVLSDFVERVKRKNKNNLCKLPLTISAQYGLVDQISFFNKVIASENMSNYYLLHKGDFAYNKSYSSEYPWGAIKRLDCYEQGTLSSLYICFKPYSHVSSDFLTHYFETSKWHQGISEIAVEGARNHGLLNVGIQDFFETRHCLPQSLLEQEKIAKFLNLIEERIATQNKIIEKYESLIQAIIYKTKRDGISKGTWRKIDLYEVLQERNEKNVEGRTICSVSVSQGVVNQIEYLGRSFAAKQTSHYNVVKYGDIVYTKSPTGDFPYGIIKRSDIREDVAVSPLYGVYIPANDSMGVILHFYFMQPCNAFNYLHPLIQKGAKNTINTSNGRFLENSVPLPVSESEANTIAVMLKSIQAKIEIEKKLLQLYAKEKEYLLHQMFI